MEEDFNLKKFLKNCKYTWKVAKKPDLKHYKVLLKVSFLGIMLIGLVGFALHIIKGYLH